MAVVIITTLPPMATRAIDEAVAEELDTVTNPPDGLIIHTASESDGQVTIVDVWESRAAFEKFEADRLFPAVQKATGMDPRQAPPPQRAIHDTYRLEKPR